jgi:hypothetical protein
MHSGRCGIIHLLPAFDEPFQITRVDQDASHDTAIAGARARDADGGDVCVEHEIAQRPVAAAKLRRCGLKVHQPATRRSRSLPHRTPVDERNLVGHHVRAEPRSTERFVKAEARTCGSSESESLDEREASARIQRREGRPKLPGELRTAAAKIQRMVRATTRDRCAPIVAQCVKQSSLPSRASTNACRRPRRSSRQIGPPNVACQS